MSIEHMLAHYRMYTYTVLCTCICMCPDWLEYVCTYGCITHTYICTYTVHVEYLCVHECTYTLYGVFMYVCKYLHRMNFDDFKNNFTDLEICNITLDSFDEDDDGMYVCVCT